MELGEIGQRTFNQFENFVPFCIHTPMLYLKTIYLIGQKSEDWGNLKESSQEVDFGLIVESRVVLFILFGRVEYGGNV